MTALNEPSVSDCVSRQELKEYLAGWTQPDQCDFIEAHLADCLACEETIAKLETDPETLVDVVRHLPRSAGARSSADSKLAHAMESAHAIMSHADGQATESKGSELVTESPFLEREFGAYEVLEPLGRGGMATVYIAKHRKLGKRVALKLLPARSFRNEQFAMRFQREIRAAGGMDHPAIVRATDAGEYQGTHFLAMELIEGLDLSRIMKLTGPLSISNACAIAYQVAQGLSHAHSQGIVHRDVKPSNLMLNAEGQTKILDFGLARLGPWDDVSAELTTVGQLMGTLDYMAPEQAERAESVDYRVDLYSLGATLFALLCGRPPLAAAPDLSPLAKLRLLATQVAPRLDTLRSDVPGPLNELVGRLLHPDANQRPASAAHVAEQLKPLCEGEQLGQLIGEALERSKQVVETAASDQDAKVAFGFLEPALPKEPPKRRQSWWAIALFAPLLIIAGIVVLLETQKGQLVIESEAEVRVKIAKDGKPYRELQVEPGANTTRLYAGKYELEIEGGSDRVQFSEDRIVIVKGETQLATVELRSNVTNTKDPSDWASGNEAEGAVDRESSGLLYEGKPLTWWLGQLERERSPSALGKAFEAIHALNAPANSGIISEALLHFGPHIKGDLRVGAEGSERILDGQLFDLLLETCDQEEYNRLLRRELKSENADWRARVLKWGDLEYYATEPLLDWFDENVFFVDETSPHLEYAIVQYKTILCDPDYAEEILTRVENSLTRSMHVAPESWIRAPWLGERETPVLMLSKRHALSTFRAPNPPQDLLHHSAIILSELARRKELNPAELEEVDQGLNRHLAAITDESMTETIPVDVLERDFNIPRIQPWPSTGTPTVPLGSSAFMLLISAEGSIQEGNLFAKLLELTFWVHQSDDEMDLPTEISRIYLSLNQRAEEIRAKHELKGRATLEWPSLNWRQWRGGRQPLEISPEEWMVILLHMQARSILQKLDPPEEKPAAGTLSARNPMSWGPRTANEPLYDGRPLSEWLAILPREKNREGIDNALNALSSMVTPDTEDKILDAIEKTLPRANWVSGNVDFGCNVLWRKDPKRFLAFMKVQLEQSKDLNWQRMLLGNAFRTDMTLDQFESLDGILRDLVKPGSPLLSDVFSVYREACETRRRTGNGNRFL